MNVNVIFGEEGKVNGCAQSLLLDFVGLTLRERRLGNKRASLAYVDKRGSQDSNTISKSLQFIQLF